jgi:hypothetical protein
LLGNSHLVASSWLFFFLAKRAQRQTQMTTGRQTDTKNGLINGLITVQYVKRLESIQLLARYPMPTSLKLQTILIITWRKILAQLKEPSSRHPLSLLLQDPICFNFF